MRTGGDQNTINSSGRTEESASASTPGARGAAGFSSPEAAAPHFRVPFIADTEAEAFENTAREESNPLAAGPVSLSFHSTITNRERELNRGD